MKNLKGKVAVVTGSAAGIGLAMAERFAKEGMKVVLSDVNASMLDTQVKRLRLNGFDVCGFVTDVSSAHSVAQLAEHVISQYGKVHLLCNNAGIGGGAADDKAMWQASLEDWKWVMDINIWGVIHGIRSFVPLLSHGEGAHIINTASKAGLMSSTSLYSTSKHTVIAISEALQVQLKVAGLSIDVSVLCPGAVNTQLQKNSEKIRPVSQPQLNATTTDYQFIEKYRTAVRRKMAAGKSPDEIAEMLMQGLAKGDFYILPSVLEDLPIDARYQNIHERQVVDFQKTYPQFFSVPTPA